VAGGLLLTVAGLLDLLDGAVARNGGLQTRFGAVLDSTLDRFGDMAVFLGCAAHFAWRGNVTYVLLSGLGLIATVQISYVKARAERFTEGMGVGFWQRGERIVALILAGVSGRVPAALWVLGIFPMATVVRRLRHCRYLVETERAPAERSTALAGIDRRGSPLYVFVCAVIALWILVAPYAHPVFYGATDPLRAWIGG